MYDFIFLILNEPEIPSSLYYYGMLIGVSNDVEGIGNTLTITHLNTDPPVVESCDATNRFRIFKIWASSS